MKREYRRHLPHQIPEGVPIFITWNLKGAMPHAVIERLKHERMRLHRAPQRPGESPTDRAVRESTLLFARADDFLDNCGAGPRLLENPDAARIVETAILAGVSQRYTLWAWCIMANHVHVLLTPIVALATVMQHLKGGTSFELNRLTNERGRIVWQDESYDHWARDEEEMLRIVHYIENNPVKAKLCLQPSEYAWSSARLRNHWPIGEPYVGQASA